MREEILRVLNKVARPLNEIEIQKNMPDKVQLDILCETLRTMEKSGDVYFTKKNTYTLYKYTHLKVGRLSVSKNGYGFVILENEPDIHISKENMNGAIHNDLVAAEYVSSEEGRIVKIIDRSFNTFVGEYVEYEPGKGKISIDDSRMKLEIFIDEEHRNGAMPGHKVIVKPYRQVSNDTYYGEVTKILGHKDDVGVDILAKEYEWDIEPNFSDETMEEIKSIPLKVSAEDIAGRRDLRNIPLVTIDGDDAKDFDDAIYAEKLPDGNIKVIVSIADVTHYVKEGTALGKDAEERATSVYLADRVTPMLPHQLSNGICSLNPNEDRLTMTCEMEINSNGRVIKYDIYESVMNSALRMTYNKVNKYLEQGIVEPGYEKFTKMLSEAHEASKYLRKMKNQRGSIDFNIPEIRIVVSEEGIPTDIVKREMGEGQKLIEDLMIAANETVAEYITNCGYPMMYRIHDVPKEKNVREYLMLLKSLGHNVKINGKIRDLKPKQVQEILSQLKHASDYEILCEFSLRAMQKAVYSINNVGHFGLASKCYCHFTSPIRRYPDDTVHRILKIILHGDKMTPKDLSDLEEKLIREAEHSSLKEKNAIECERDVNDMKTAEYMQHHIGEKFSGKVSGVVPSGMFIRLDNGIEGKVFIGSISGDYYIVDEYTQSIVGKKSGKRYRLGDTVDIIVKEASKIEGTVDFEIFKEINKK